MPGTAQETEPDLAFSGNALPDNIRAIGGDSGELGRMWGQVGSWCRSIDSWFMWPLWMTRLSSPFITATFVPTRCEMDVRFFRGERGAGQSRVQNLHHCVPAKEETPGGGSTRAPARGPAGCDVRGRQPVRPAGLGCGLQLGYRRGVHLLACRRDYQWDARHNRYSRTTCASAVAVIRRRTLPGTTPTTWCC